MCMFLSEGQAGEACKRSKRRCCFGDLGALGRPVLFTFFSRTAVTVQNTHAYLPPGTANSNAACQHTGCPGRFAVEASSFADPIL
jgi:hypothetical protein